MEKPDRERRLNSWKEIAAYLERTPRTVRRWESDEGLPVHRIRHVTRHSVYAYPSELEAWRLNRKPLISKEELPVSLWRRPAPSFATAMLVFLALIRVGDVSPQALQLRAADHLVGATARLVWVNGQPEGTISQDARLFSITHWASGGNIGVHDMVTGKDRQLTDELTSGDYTEGTAISRDGSRIAYMFWGHEANHSELRVVRTDQDPSEPSQRLYVSEDVSWLAPYDWSPDGEWISVDIVRKGRRTDLALVNSTDGTLRILKSFFGNEPRHISFSPDGRYVAYDAPSENAANGRDIFVAAVDGSQDEGVVQHPAQDVVVDWSLDGRSLLFSSDRSGSPGLWSLPITDGKAQGPAQLLSSGFDGPGFMTDSGQLYHEVYYPHRDVYVADFDFHTGKLTSAPGNVVPRFVGTNMMPQWSPDGTKLAFSSGRNTGNVVGILSMETGKIKEFRNLGQPRAWSPGGDSLALCGSLAGRQGFIQLNPESGKSQELIVGDFDEIRCGGDSWSGSWSADGTAFYYLRWLPDEQMMSLRLRRIASGTERELFRHPDLSAVSASPDGQWLALNLAEETGARHDLFVMPVDGGPPRKIMSTIASASGLGWAPDSQSVIVWRGDGDNWQAFLSGREPRQLADLGAGPISVHPDGRQIAFWTSDKPTYELWVLENFMPEAGTVSSVP